MDAAHARLALLGSTAALVLPTTAGAMPTLMLDRPCYTPGQGLAINGGGYTPGGQVMMLVSVLSQFGNKYGGYRDPLTADPAGNITGKLQAPPLASTRDTEELAGLSANDQQRAQQNAPPEEQAGLATFTLSAFDLAVDPWNRRRVDPTKRTTFAAYGFEGLGPTLYAHYFLHGKLRKTVRVGSLHGDCGDLTTKMKQFPFRPVPPGDYTVDFDTSRRVTHNADGIRYRHVRVKPSKAVR